MTEHRYATPRRHPGRDLPHPDHGSERIDCARCRHAAWAAYEARLAAWQARKDAHAQRPHRVREALGFVFGLLVLASPFLIFASGAWIGLVQGALDLLVLAFYPVLGLASGTVTGEQAVLVLVLGWGFVGLVSIRRPGFSEPEPKISRFEHDAFAVAYLLNVPKATDVPHLVEERRRLLARRADARHAACAARITAIVGPPREADDDLPF